MQYYDVIITNTMLFISSVNYWRKPVLGIRRNFDMATCLFCLVYNTYTVYEHPVTIYHYIAIGGTPLFYLISCLLHKYNYKRLSTFSHCMCHLTGNIGSYVIFYGIFSVPILYEISVLTSSCNISNV